MGNPLDRKRLNTVNIYPPNNDSKWVNFFADITSLLSTSHENISTGDFIYAFEVKLDKFGGNSVVFYLNDLIAGFDLSEI